MTGRLKTKRHDKWKTYARRFLLPLAEAGWQLAFVIAGRLLHLRVTELTPTGTDRILVLAPHPDDETLGCGGTIRRHLEAGDHVTVLIVTDGSGSRAGGLGPDTMRMVRASEAVEAVARLGPAQLVQLGYCENRWTEQELLAALQSHLGRIRPTVIYTTSAVDFHPEHRRVAAVLARTLATVPLPSLHAVRVYEVQVPLTPLLVNRLVDTTRHETGRRQALEAYVTQRPSFGWRRRQTKYLRSIYNKPGHYEAFWELSPPAFTRVMAVPGDAHTWRGLRRWAYADGLAWTTGWKARNRLGAAAGRKSGPP